MCGSKFNLIPTCMLLAIYCLTVITGFEDDHDHAFHHGHDLTGHQHDVAIPNRDHSQHKDKVLLKDVQSLVFYRNKRTTSKRTHSIHQLSCVGGTAGCKLFTPDSVECENLGSAGDDKTKISWRCHAEMSDRVQFNHVEVICEGYDYAEDDYILVGSCGLEFTLDYKDPHDYHHQSYFGHMDDHEKEMHHERVRQKLNANKGSASFATQVTKAISDNLILIGPFILLVLVSFILVIYFSSRGRTHERTSKSKVRPISGYGPLTSAVMTTKKAC